MSLSLDHARSILAHALANRDRAGQFVRAAGDWLVAGAPLRPPAEQTALAAICAKCLTPVEIGPPLPGWDATAAGGMGACRHCGCLAFKRALATARCPLGKWPA